MTFVILFILSIENLQLHDTFYTTQKYSAIQQLGSHKEQDVMSAPWLGGGKEQKEAKLLYIEQLTKKMENALKRGLGGCLTDGKHLNVFN